jgi:hypothetical protein
MKKSVSITLIGELRGNSKMSAKTWNLPALVSCPTGAKLAKIAGSVCATCYATKGNYRFGNVQDALRKRMTAVDRPEWVDAMVAQIGEAPFFRWHASGDLYSREYALKVMEVCKRTPNTQHWIPTKERALASDLMRSGLVPDNVCLRVSGAMVDGAPLKVETGLATSTVFSHKVGSAIGFECPAPSQGGKCSTCNACWQRGVANVAYAAH